MATRYMINPQAIMKDFMGGGFFKLGAEAPDNIEDLYALASKAANGEFVNIYIYDTLENKYLGEVEVVQDTGLLSLFQMRCTKTTVYVYKYDITETSLTRSVTAYNLADLTERLEQITIKA